MNKKTIWITGGSSGIGKAVAIKFANNGWNVAISARREDILNEISDKNENIEGIQGFENLYRYRFGIEKKFNTNYLNFDLRVAYQNRVSLDRKAKFKKRLRIRPSAEIKIKDWINKPKLFYEYFDEIEGNDQKAHRYGISFKKNVTNNQSFTFRYFFQKYNEAFNLDYYNNVISLKYSFD